MEARTLDPLPGPEADPEAFYHPHEEDSVPVSGVHDAIGLYLESALGVYLPERWVAADLCCYWIPGNNRVYLAPDVFVAERGQPDPLPSSFRLWEHGPLRLVIEIGSRTSLRRHVRPKLDRYAKGLLPGEYLYYDADHRDLRLYRRTAEGYAAVPPDATGKVWSAVTDAGFAVEDGGLLRAFDSRGNALPSPREADRLRGEADRLRGEADRLRREADRLRRESEGRAAALEAELARLRKAE